MLVIGFTFYTYCAILSYFIIAASGSWMDHAFRDKLIVLFMLFLICCSILQIVPATVYRGYIVPYKSVQNYSMEVIIESEDSASILVMNIFNPVVYDVSNSMIQVRKVSRSINDPVDLPPDADLIYSDDKYSHTTVLMENQNISREIYGLKDGEWYMFLVLPARKGSNGDAFPSKYIKEVDSVQIGHTLYQDLHVDIRAFKRCLWSKSIGCSSDGLIH